MYNDMCSVCFKYTYLNEENNNNKQNEKNKAHLMRLLLNKFLKNVFKELKLK